MLPLLKTTGTHNQQMQRKLKTKTKALKRKPYDNKNESSPQLLAAMYLHWKTHWAQVRSFGSWKEKISFESKSSQPGIVFQRLGCQVLESNSDQLRCSAPKDTCTKVCSLLALLEMVANLSRQAWVAGFAGLLFGQRRNSKWPMWFAVSSIRTCKS